eukprot:5434911-Amphidinium_carterae.1
MGGFGHLWSEGAPSGDVAAAGIAVCGDWPDLWEGNQREYGLVDRSATMPVRRAPVDIRFMRSVAWRTRLADKRAVDEGGRSRKDRPVEHGE